ncbi:MAG TPA: penicillin-binding transpeptidase domain-containing protein, partial [Streptomyces sp.]
DTVWKNEKGEEWLQTNDGNVSLGNPPDYKIDLREAMRESVNSAFVQLGMDVGTDKVRAAAISAGLVPSLVNGLNNIGNSPTYSIGTSSPSAIRMASAYSTFDNNGRQNYPYSVDSVVHEGGVMWKHKVKTKVAFDPNVANTITGMLTDVVKKGTGTPAQLDDGRVAAGKTGTTDNNVSAWFDGFTPQLSTSIVMFRRDDVVHMDKSGKQIVNQFLPMYGTGGKEKIHGNSFPAQIWHDYMTAALAGTPKLDFQEPTQKVGDTVYGNVPSPTPTPSMTTPPPTTPPATSPPPSTPTNSPTSTPTPTDTPTKHCFPWDPTCNTTSPTPTDTSTTGPPGGGKPTKNPNGN